VTESGSESESECDESECDESESDESETDESETDECESASAMLFRVATAPELDLATALEEE
jgi:hypothetical protein